MNFFNLKNIKLKKEFSNKTVKRQRGFTLMEIILVISLLVLIAGITSWALSGFGNSQALDRDTTAVGMYIKEARALTQGSFEDNQYGVSFYTDRVVLFSGTEENENSIIRIHEFHTSVEIESYSLQNETNKIVFERLTGSPSTQGTVTLRSSQSNQDRVLSISSLGIVESVN